MSTLALTLLGLLARHALGGLGVWLLSQGLDPKSVDAINTLIQSLGPVGGAIVGALSVAGALGWSYYQKHKSGVLSNIKKQSA